MHSVDVLSIQSRAQSTLKVEFSVGEEKQHRTLHGARFHLPYNTLQTVILRRLPVDRFVATDRHALCASHLDGPLCFELPLSDVHD